MKKEDRDYISQQLGVEPVMIDAALVSGQNRKRLFWCNWKVKQPVDRGITGKYCQYRRNHWRYNKCGKCPSLTANMGSGGNNVPYKIIGDNKIKLTPIECERLQCFPDNWTEGVSNTQRYKQLGNAVNTDVVKHIFNELKRSEK